MTRAMPVGGARAAPRREGGARESRDVAGQSDSLLYDASNSQACGLRSAGHRDLGSPHAREGAAAAPPSPPIRRVRTSRARRVRRSTVAPRSSLQTSSATRRPAPRARRRRAPTRWPRIPRDSPRLSARAAPRPSRPPAASNLDNNLPSACLAVAGQLSNGSICGDSSQCQSAYCNTGADGTCGACGAARGGPGATCERDDDCTYGSLCESGSCVTPGTAGATCDGTHVCQKTLTCRAGICSTPAGAGTACTTGSCNALAGLYCSTGSSPVCTSITLAAVGQPCGLINGALVACSASGHCDVVTGTGAGTCKGAAADGAACDDTNGPMCLSPATCGATSKVCTLPDPSNCH